MKKEAAVQVQVRNTDEERHHQETAARLLREAEEAVAALPQPVVYNATKHTGKEPLTLVDAAKGELHVMPGDYYIQRDDGSYVVVAAADLERSGGSWAKA